ncbi:MAG: ATP-binding protein, partial [Rhodothermales bacterium]
MFQGLIGTRLLLIDDILDFSKIEAGHIELGAHAFDLRTCVAVDLPARPARDKGIHLAYHIDPDVPAFLVTDSTRLRQILVNLVSNAVKFTPEGEVVVSVRTTQTAPDACQIHVAVRDTGIGIEPEQLDGLFNPFVQGDASITRRYGGTGLGLAICKNLCQLLGGDIWGKSKPGVGSVFFFTIAAQLAAEAPASEQGTPAPLSETPTDEENAEDRTALRILLAEDNIVNQMVALRMLQRLGYRADVASNGYEVIEAVRRQRYDIVLMDMQMPEMDGLEATRRVRADFPAARQPYIVALT